MTGAVTEFGAVVEHFGQTISDVARWRHEQAIEGRQDAQKERQARRNELRQQVRQGAEGARERNRERKGRLARTLKMPTLPELGQFAGKGRMRSNGPGNAGTFSSAALAFLGTTATTPEKRTADGVAHLVDIQQQMLDNQHQGGVPRVRRLRFVG